MQKINWRPDFLFDPSHTFESGQVFRWSRMGSEQWQGIVSGNILIVDRAMAQVEVISSLSSRREQEELVRKYFSEKDDLSEIVASFPNDEFLSAATNEYKGLRLLTQDPWECLLSFVCSINSNIPSIRFKIENLARRFGRPIGEHKERCFYSFPDAKTLASADKDELIACKVGFRWKYIQFIARKVASRELDLENIKKLSYENARSELISEVSEKTFGVGPKVADCVLLFSMGHHEAFPIDIWMIRCIFKNYHELVEDHFEKNRFQMTPAKYSEVSRRMRRHFGKYAGYAQQYLYMKTRSDALSLKIKGRLERKRQS